MPKGSMWSSVPLPCCLSSIVMICYGSRAAVSKGAMSVLCSFYALLDARSPGHRLSSPSHGLLLLLWLNHIVFTGLPIDLAVMEAHKV